MTTTQSTPLKKILMQRGKGSVADLAQQCDVTREHMSAVANASAAPSWPLKQKIAAVLGKDVDELWPTKETA